MANRSERFIEDEADDDPDGCHHGVSFSDVCPDCEEEIEAEEADRANDEIDEDDE